MIDLTGANLVAYLMRVIKDAVIRNPRFRNTLGEVTFASNNQVNWNDTQIVIKSVSSSGTRLSPDYFMCTQHARALLAKVGDKEGAFVEWVIETDKTRLTPTAGVYYLNVDAVDEQTRNVNLTCRQFRWVQGSLTNAEGTNVGLRAGIDGTTLTAFDASNLAVPLQIQAFTTLINLLTPCNKLILQQGGTTLVPNVDYWILRKQSHVILQSAAGGMEFVSLPPGYTTLDLVDQDGYILRPNLDYTFQGPNFVVLSQFTPPGTQITATGVFQLNPAAEGIPATNPENVLSLVVGPTEKLATGQVFISTPAGNFPNVTVQPNGLVTLPTLLLPGDWLKWEVRILTTDFTMLGKKYELNAFKKTVFDPKAGAPDANTPGPGAFVVALDSNGNPIDAIPGMSVAIGDSVVVGDQCVIIVNPDVTETYEVFGSKENLTFTLDCRSNDFQTSSDLSELLKKELLIMRRQNMEADGITIFEATRENQGEQRDPSGTAPRYTFTVSVSASADWKVFVPCVTRLVRFEIQNPIFTDGFLGKINMAPRIQAFGAFQFIPAYA